MEDAAIWGGQTCTLNNRDSSTWEKKKKEYKQKTGDY